LVFRLADKPEKANLVDLRPGKLFDFLNESSYSLEYQLLSTCIYSGMKSICKYLEQNNAYIVPNVKSGLLAFIVIIDAFFSSKRDCGKK